MQHLHFHRSEVARASHGRLRRSFLKDCQHVARCFQHFKRNMIQVLSRLATSFPMNETVGPMHWGCTYARTLPRFQPVPANVKAVDVSSSLVEPEHVDDQCRLVWLGTLGYDFRPNQKKNHVSIKLVAFRGYCWKSH